MACNGYDKVLDLADRELIELRDVRGATLRVTRGTLWVTQHEDSRDVVLRAGDVWTVERQGLTLAEAQGASTVCILGATAERVGGASPNTRFEERLAAWLEALARSRNGRPYIPYI